MLEGGVWVLVGMHNVDNINYAVLVVYLVENAILANAHHAEFLARIVLVNWVAIRECRQGLDFLIDVGSVGVGGDFILESLSDVGVVLADDLLGAFEDDYFIPTHACSLRYPGRLRRRGETCPGRWRTQLD